MPIEREYKYVLDHKSNLEDKLDAMVQSQSITVYGVKQGYLGKGGRIREKTYHYVHGAPVIFSDRHEKPVEFVFTYKHNLKDCHGCLEIEQEISKADFDLAWSDAHHIIDKVRYVVKCENDFVWEIDFFKHNGKTFFVLAECEVDLNQSRPSRSHPIVEEHLLFAVPETDQRFQNRKLSNRKKVAKLLKEIVNGKAKA